MFICGYGFLGDAAGEVAALAGEAATVGAEACGEADAAGPGASPGETDAAGPGTTGEAEAAGWLESFISSSRSTLFRVD